MEPLDIINFFLHDELAAKMWKRTLDHVNGDIHTYIYSSVNNPRYCFALVWCRDDDYVWIRVENHGCFVTLLSNDISELHSNQYGLVAKIGKFSDLDIICGSKPTRY